MSSETAFEIGRLFAPIAAIANVLTSSQDKIFLELPALVGWWPGGPTNQGNAAMRDMASAQEAAQIGTCPLGFDGHPYRVTGNGTNYFNNVSIGGFTGTETWVDATIRGFTVGMWVYLETTPTPNPEGLISKDASSPNRGYVLFVDTADMPGFQVSSTGAAVFSAVSPQALDARWSFVVGRFIPSTEVAIFVDGVKTTNTTAIPATQNVSPQNFEIGRFFNGNDRIIHARMRDVFICAAVLSDETVAQIRETSAP